MHTVCPILYWCSSSFARWPIGIYMYQIASSKNTDKEEAPWRQSPQWCWYSHMWYLSHIPPVMSLPLLVGSRQRLHVQARVTLQTTGVAWLSLGISGVTAVLAQQIFTAVRIMSKAALGLSTFDQRFQLQSYYRMVSVAYKWKMWNAVVLKLAQICDCAGKRTGKCMLSRLCLWCKTY